VLSLVLVSISTKTAQSLPRAVFAGISGGPRNFSSAFRIFYRGRSFPLGSCVV
jgi:hypothetical protein